MWSEKKNFLSTAIASIDEGGGQAVNGSEFNSEEYPVPTDMANLGMEFTIATGDGKKIVFEWQASYDNGATWTTVDFAIREIDSDEDDDSNVIRDAMVIWTQGISHIRLWRVTNNDAVTAITSVNAYLSYGIRR